MIRHGDRVVSAVNYEGSVLLFTEQGTVILCKKDISDRLTFHMIADIPRT